MDLGAWILIITLICISCYIIYLATDKDSWN